MSRRFCNNLSSLLLILVLPTQLIAQNVTDFYPEGSASSIYMPAPNKSDPPEIGNFLEQNRSDSTGTNNPTPKQKKKAQREALFKEFGEPDNDPSINVRPDAPKPYKALMAALEMGDDKLAFQYAKQYVRYMRNLNQRVDKVTKLSGLAAEREGLLGAGGWQRGKELDQYRHLLQEDLAKEKKNAETELGSLDSRTLELLQRAERDEGVQNNQSQQQSSQKYHNTNVNRANARQQSNAAPRGASPTRAGKPPAPVDDYETEIVAERRARIEVRQALAAKVQAEPSGEIDILFFFKPRDTNSELMYSEIEQLYQAVKNDHRIRLMGISLDLLQEEQWGEISREFGITFPAREHNNLVKALNVSGYPTTVFIGRVSKRMVHEKGYRRFFYMDELIKLMQGKIGLKR